MLSFLLLLTVTLSVESQKIPGEQKNDSCVCKLSSSIWAFPAVRFEKAMKQLQTCEENLIEFQKRIRDVELPKMKLTLKNIKSRQKRSDFANRSDLYKSLHLQELILELEEIYNTASEVHKKNPSKTTNDLLKEVQEIFIKIVTGDKIVTS